MVAYSALRQVCAPTAIEHAVSARFTTPHCNELIVARRQMLQVYRVLDDHSIRKSHLNESFTHSGSGSSSANAGAGLVDVDSDAACLELRCEFELSGVVESLSVVRLRAQQQHQCDRHAAGALPGGEPLPAPGTDALLLTFGEGKVSLVAFDPSVGPRRALVTLSMFDFEDAPVASSGLQASRGGLRRFVGYGAKASALVDPASQCAVMLMYGSQLVVIPFTGANDCDAGLLSISCEGDDAKDGARGAAASSSSAQKQADDADSDTDGDGDDDDDDDDDDDADGAFNNNNSNNNNKGDGGGRNGKREFVVHYSSSESMLANAASNRGRLFAHTPFLLRLPLRGIPCGSVRDLAFLHGYHPHSPVLAVLYTTAAQTWTARGVARRHWSVFARDFLESAARSFALCLSWFFDLKKLHVGGPISVENGSSLFFIFPSPDFHIWYFL
jgi:hypothetical protein